MLPSEVINLHNAGAKGIISKENTSSSHVQILLSSLNMPSATSVENLPVALLNGHNVLINTLKGKIAIDPPKSLVDSVLEDFRNRKDDIILRMDFRKKYRLKIGISNKKFLKI